MKDTFLELINNRQSCRDFNDLPLTKETVLDIAKAGMLAPSACNMQPWKIQVVTSEGKVKEVASCLQDRGMNKFTDKAKAFIVISEKDLSKPEREGVKFTKYHFVKYDIGEYIAYATLRAESLGVSSCIIGWIDRERLKKVVNLTDDQISHVVIALGYSDAPVRKKIRNKVEDVITEI